MECTQLLGWVIIVEIIAAGTMGCKPTAIYVLIAHARCHDVAFTFLLDTHDHYQSKAKLRKKITVLTSILSEQFSF